MKKLFIAIIFTFLIVFLSFFCNKTFAGYQYFNNLDFDVKVNSDASMEVTETWNIKIENTNTLFKTFKTDFSKYSGISNVKVSEVINSSEQNFEQINQLMYHVTKNCYYGMKNNNGDFEIAWGVGLDNSSDTRTYKISYKVEDAIKKYSDFSELYWQFIGSDFEIDANKITGKITLPASVESKDEIKVWGHTEGLNGEIYATSLNTIEFEVNKFRSGRYVEIRALFPNYLITSSKRISNFPILDEVLKEETRWAEEANLKRKKADMMRKATTIVFIVVIVILCLYNLKTAKKRSEKAKTI